MLYALVLAGGSGTRLWPYSRSHNPKQFLHVGNPRTMLQETIERTLPIIPADRIVVATNAAYAQIVTEQVPSIPRQNILAEPVGRGTAASIGLAALQIQRQDPDAVMVVLSADHRIAYVDCYCDALVLGSTLAAQGHLVVLGLEPTSPQPSYGYIELGESLEQKGYQSAYKVACFDEKPDIAQAELYVASGRHLWNAGMFVWSAERILHELATYQPELMRRLEQVDTYLSQNDDSSFDTATHVWSLIENISIDVAVMEQTCHAVVIPANLGRQDVGDWNSLYEAQAQNYGDNVVVGQHVGMDTKRTLIYAEQRVVATIGLENFVVVDTADALLICPRDRAQDVKKLVTQLHHQHKHMV